MREDEEQFREVLPYFALPIGVMLLIALIISTFLGAAAPPDPFEEEADGDQSGVTLTKAERAFQEQMSNVVLTGHFTVGEEPGESTADSYQIVSVKKTGAHAWIINARIAYGPGSENLPALPIPVHIHWAGDTPVLSLTDLTIPGLGTFTSRVLFYNNRYAGTWQHGEKGGHLFGTIRPVEEVEKEKK